MKKKTYKHTHMRTYFFTVKIKKKIKNKFTLQKFTEKSAIFHFQIVPSSLFLGCVKVSKYKETFYKTCYVVSFCPH